MQIVFMADGTAAVKVEILAVRSPKDGYMVCVDFGSDVGQRMRLTDSLSAALQELGYAIEKGLDSGVEQLRKEFGPAAPEPAAPAPPAAEAV